MIRARAYIHPKSVPSCRETARTTYRFWTFCEECPQWPWPPKEQRNEAYVVHTCHESEYPDDPCSFFAYMDGGNRDDVWVHCKSPKWND